jgi:hypothetical protein
LSTAIGNRQLPIDERWDPQIFWFLFRFVSSRVPRAAGSHAVQVLYQNAWIGDKRAARTGAQARENRSDNFFMFVTEETHGDNPQFAQRA